MERCPKLRTQSFLLGHKDIHVSIVLTEFRLFLQSVLIYAIALCERDVMPKECVEENKKT